MPEVSFDLTNLGLADDVRRAMQLYPAPGLEPARVSAVHRDAFRVYTATGERDAEAIGALLYRAESRAALPVVGDWVAVAAVAPGQAMIHAVLPRRTLFSRRAAGPREEEQPIAANIDLIVTVCGLDGDYNPRRIERYLALSRQSGAAAAVVLNKADLCQAPEARVAEVAGIAPGTPVLAVCAHRPPDIQRLAGLTTGGRTLALVGSSGAGKSTIINALLGAQCQRVESVRQADSRGRHTTTARELFPLPGAGALIDTPGMREVQLWADEDSLDGAFTGFAALAAGCRFRNCGHTVETGCAIRAALDAGALDPDRYRSYLKLRAEVAFHTRQSDASAALAHKRRWKQIHKSMRQHYRGQDG